MAGNKSTKLVNPQKLGLHLAAGAGDEILTSALYVYDETKEQSVQDTLDSIDLSEYATETFVNDKLVNTVAYKENAEVIDNKKLSVFDNAEDPVVLKSYITELLKQISDLDTRLKALEGKFTVTFYDYEGGNLLSTQRVVSGGSAIAPEDPEREGYTFKGWDKDFTNITSDTVVNGTWEEIVTELDLGTEWRNHEKATDPETTDTKIIETTTNYPYTSHNTTDMVSEVDSLYPSAYNEETDSYTFTDEQIESLLSRYYVPAGYSVYNDDNETGATFVYIYKNTNSYRYGELDPEDDTYRENTAKTLYIYKGTDYTIVLSDSDTLAEIIIRS